jgi:UDP:flavonoid glycosyltransferase YjiC (YdhE family)
LTALRKPFIFFPLEGHFEQEIHVAKRLERYRAGIKMRFSETTPGTLANQVISNIGREVNYASISTDGAQKTAALIKEMVSR